jgi:hypothetical protein
MSRPSFEASGFPELVAVEVLIVRPFDLYLLVSLGTKWRKNWGMIGRQPQRSPLAISATLEYTRSEA